MSIVRFFKNLAAYSIADLLGKSILLLLSPILTRLLTHEQYGSIPLLAASWAILAVIQFGGFDFAFQMFRAQTIDEHERERIRITATVMSSAFLFVFWIGLAIFALTTDVVTSFAAVSKIELLFFLLAIIPASLAYWSIYVFRFMHLAIPYARINLLTRVVSIVIALPFIYMAKQEDRLLAMLMVIFISQALSLLWVATEYKMLNLPIYKKDFFSKELAGRMFRFGIVFFPSTLIYSSTIYVDRMIMGYYSTIDQVAILGLAVTLSTGILMIKGWFSMVWDPQLLDWLATKNPKFYLPKLQLSMGFLVIIFASITLLSKLWSKEFVDLVYPPHFAGVSDLIPYLVMAGSVSVLTLVAIASAIIQNTARFRTLIYSGALLTNIFTAITLIPHLGLKGAAIGTLLGETFVLLSWIVIGKLVWKNLDLNWTLPLFALIIIFLFIHFYSPGYFLSRLTEQLFFTGAIFLVLLFTGWKSKASLLLLKTANS
jgi:O-antigen/teichoic acid export membrane protein